MHAQHRAAVHSTQGQIELMDKLRVHADQYASQSKANYMAMVDIYSDLEIDDDQQRQEVEDIMANAMSCWSSAVTELRARQQAVRDSIQCSLSNIMSIKEELGADNPAADADLQRLQASMIAEIRIFCGTCSYCLCPENRPTSLHGQDTTWCCL